MECSKVLDKKTIFRGKAAEYILVAALLLEGIECYIPVTDRGRIDVLAGDKLIRAQVKVIYKRHRQAGMPIRKCGGTHPKMYRYSVADIDVMVGVDLDSKDVYVVPIAEAIKYKATIGMKVLNAGGYKNNFSVFTDNIRT